MITDFKLYYDKNYYINHFVSNNVSKCVPNHNLQSSKLNLVLVKYV